MTPDNDSIPTDSDRISEFVIFRCVTGSEFCLFDPRLSGTCEYIRCPSPEIVSSSPDDGEVY